MIKSDLSYSTDENIIDENKEELTIDQVQQIMENEQMTKEREKEVRFQKENTHDLAKSGI